MIKAIQNFRQRREREQLRARLAATMKPDPGYRSRRLAQFSPERRERYERNVEGL